ncbi:hypothetical protein G6F62_015300 [Rhizopus arrhizus]|nr:hypothetical protein G6F62_015300 [Rhizopus arrhizus]
MMRQDKFKAAGADDREGRGEVPSGRQRLALCRPAARRAASCVLGGADRSPGQAETELSGAAALAFSCRRPHSCCNEPAEYRPHDRIRRRHPGPLCRIAAAGQAAAPAGR